MKLLKILENRNRCLKKISEFSEAFLSRMGSDATPDLAELESFEIWRNNAIKTLLLYDNHIKVLAKTLSTEDKNEKFKVTVRNILEIGENFIYYIKTIDMKIIERIETEKANLLKTLVAAEQSKKVVNKFRSEIVSKSGGQLDGKI
ncbi:MAG: hypothetical protein ABI041_01915 [Bdellovibrionia bacterium]